MIFKTKVISRDSQGKVFKTKVGREMYLVVDFDAINDMLDDNFTMNNLTDYDAAIAINLDAAYQIADKFIMEQEVTQAMIIPLDDNKILAATLKPIHEIISWPENEIEPVLPEPIYPDCEDCE